MSKDTISIRYYELPECEAGNINNLSANFLANLLNSCHCLFLKYPTYLIVCSTLPNASVKLFKG